MDSGLYRAQLTASFGFGIQSLAHKLLNRLLCRPIRSLAFFPDGKRVISGAENSTIRVWDIERGEEDCLPLREHPQEVDAIVVSNDGRRVISGSKDHTIGIWDADYLVKALINSFLG